MRNHQIEVHRNIVPIVPVPPVKSTQTINNQSLRGRNNKNFIVPGPYFPAFYRSICSRIPGFVVQTKGMDCTTGVYDKLYRRRGLASSEPDHSERYSQIPLY